MSTSASRSYSNRSRSSSRSTEPVRAYRDTARVLRTLGRDVAPFLAEGGDLTEILGIGDDLGARSARSWRRIPQSARPRGPRCGCTRGKNPTTPRVRRADRTQPHALKQHSLVPSDRMNRRSSAAPSSTHAASMFASMAARCRCTAACARGWRRTVSSPSTTGSSFRCDLDDRRICKPSPRIVRTSQSALSSAGKRASDRVIRTARLARGCIVCR